MVFLSQKITKKQKYNRGRMFQPKTGMHQVPVPSAGANMFATYQITLVNPIEQSTLNHLCLEVYGGQLALDLPYLIHLISRQLPVSNALFEGFRCTHFAGAIRNPCGLTRH
jgi:hypothetical protein